MNGVLPIAAIGGEGASQALEAFVAELAAQGVQVRGLIQRHHPDMHLVDVESGQTYAITQDLGAESESCRLDPSGIAEASVVLRRALAERAALVVVNRFGKLEAAGGGLSAEMLALMAECVPMLTTVGADQLEAWATFTGGAGLVLPADQQSIRQWWNSL
ncbi:MAG: DUF2478 domain-containing protein [Magnetospirillum sp.]